MVNDVIDRSRTVGNAGMNPGGGVMPHNNFHHQNGAQISTELLIPGPKCGLIIGKSGETIKNLQVFFLVIFLIIINLGIDWSKNVINTRYSTGFYGA